LVSFLSVGIVHSFHMHSPASRIRTELSDSFGRVVGIGLSELDIDLSLQQQAFNSMVGTVAHPSYLPGLVVKDGTLVFEVQKYSTSLAILRHRNQVK
jgi:hypothetical protein